VPDRIRAVTGFELPRLNVVAGTRSGRPFAIGGTVHVGVAFATQDVGSSGDVFEQVAVTAAP
jgi:hypothetical protein